MDDLKSKISIVTGANSGIGYATAKGLLKRGAFVVLACRNAEKAREAQNRLKLETGSDAMSFIPLDLSSLGSINLFLSEFFEKFDHFDFLAQCAGHIETRKSFTPDGYDQNFMTNVLGPFALSDGLCKRNPVPARVVQIAGEFHRFFSLDMSDLTMNKVSFPVKAGSLCMLERIMFTRGLALKFAHRNIEFCSFHPGNVKTEMMDKLPLPARLAVKLLSPFQLTPDQGADTCVWLLSAAETSGKYFIARKEAKPGKEALDDLKVSGLMKILADCLSKQSVKNNM